MPQSVAYAQIAGLPPEAGLMAAPGALLAYALLGTSRTLVVSATTATSAVSAASVAPLAGGDMVRFAALSAALALVTAVLLAAAGALSLGGIADLVPKPVMTGFLFGLGLTITVAQLPSLLGVDAGDGDFFGRLRSCSPTSATRTEPRSPWAGEHRAAPALQRVRRAFPATLLVLVAAIVVPRCSTWTRTASPSSATCRRRCPTRRCPASAPAIWSTWSPALGMLVLTTEALGVAARWRRARLQVDANRDLSRSAASNLRAGLSSGFVQSGGASQTAAAEGAGGKTQLATLLAGVLVLLTGAFLAPLFEDLPQATLAAIVIVAVTGFLRADELAASRRIRTSAIVSPGSRCSAC